ncbi:unnamed protein product [Pipistrellus nathusii]|uniref:Uncharacterized protein n=1 Tax=Pipistrellus nathusii TaxID=59473 RepID=A0ABP0AI87_PIPNA
MAVVKEHMCHCAFQESHINVSLSVASNEPISDDVPVKRGLKPFRCQPWLCFLCPFINHCPLYAGVSEVSLGERWVRDRFAETILSYGASFQTTVRLSAQTTSHGLCSIGWARRESELG